MPAVPVPVLVPPGWDRADALACGTVPAAAALVLTADAYLLR